MRPYRRFHLHASTYNVCADMHCCCCNASYTQTTICHVSYDTNCQYPKSQNEQSQHHCLQISPAWHAGRFQGCPVSIVSTMMGMANMDFVVRECRAVVEGPLAMIRLGTCGAIQPPAHLGNFLVASEGSVCVRYSHNHRF